MKRLFDFIFVLLGLIFISPLLIIISVVLALSNRGTPFFFQIRPGLNNKLFKVIKFKTMSDKRDDLGRLLSDANRLTKLGSCIRKTSLDELPQLINVLKGDMSLVGPRPLLVEYLPLYSMEQSKRHLVKPGITGWAQVNGRNSISWEDKFKLDIWYVNNNSFFLDVQILYLTVGKVLKSDGVNKQGSVTTEYFNGTN